MAEIGATLKISDMARNGKKKCASGERSTDIVWEGMSSAMFAEWSAPAFSQVRTLRGKFSVGRC